jgi:DNA-binding transcriptional ArsR family regulator
MAGSTALEAVVPSRARRALLAALFSGEPPRTVSELARAARLTPRAVAQQLERLERAGLVTGETSGPSRMLRPNLHHPAAHALKALVSAAPLAEDADDRAARRALAAHGAPLAGVSPDGSAGLEEAVLLGVAGVRRDPGFLRVLPVVLARHVMHLDFERLRSLAAARGLKAELGLVLDLTADAAGLPELRQQAEPLRDGRRSRDRYLPESMGVRERELARRRSPPAARRWHFLVNVTEASLREMVGKHHG